jgi:hypothetical protein
LEKCVTLFISSKNIGSSHLSPPFSQMLSSSSRSSAPLVLQSRSHYLKRSSFQNSHRDDVLKDVNQLTDLDLDVWTALNIRGVVLDLAVLNSLNPSERQHWVQTVKTMGMTILGLDRSQKSGFDEANFASDLGLGFPVIRLNAQFLLASLKDCRACLATQPDRMVFVGRTWGDRISSLILGCRFVRVSK